MKSAPHVLLAAIDGSPAFDLVIEAAIRCACAIADAELHLVHVVEPPLAGSLPELEISGLVDDGRKLIARATRLVSESFHGPIESHVSVNLAAEGVLPSMQRRAPRRLRCGPPREDVDMG